MHIDVVAPLELSPQDIAAWRTLQTAHPEFASPYLSPDWAIACASVDGPDRRGGRVLVVRDDAGRGVGFLPVRLGGQTALPLGSPMADYQALVADPALEIDPRALVRALGADRFDFNHLLGGRAAFGPFIRGGGESQVVDISAGYEAYAAERRAGGHDILKDTAKKRRKLVKDLGEPVFAALSADAADFELLIDWKRRQYRATRQTDIFDAGWPLELLRNLHARPDGNFGGALFTLHVGGVMAAAHFALRGPGILHAWFIAHDPEFGRYSPGVVLIDHMLRWGSENGVRELDLGPGDYRFKFQLANTVRGVAHGFVGAPSPAVLAREAQYTVRAAAEALPLGRVSAWPGKAMRRVDLWRSLR
jgi:CelD/BcsL family acetyltransferase involved in cellulose biosynthesis